MSDTGLSLIMIGFAAFMIMAILACHIIKIATKDGLREDNNGDNSNNCQSDIQ